MSATVVQGLYRSSGVIQDYRGPAVVQRCRCTGVVHGYSATGLMEEYNCAGLSQGYNAYMIITGVQEYYRGTGVQAQRSKDRLHGPSFRRDVSQRHIEHQNRSLDLSRVTSHIYHRFRGLIAGTNASECEKPWAVGSLLAGFLPFNCDLLLRITPLVGVFSLSRCALNKYISPRAASRKISETEYNFRQI